MNPSLVQDKVSIIDKRIEKYVASLNDQLDYVDTRMKTYKSVVDKFVGSLDSHMNKYKKIIDSKVKSIDQTVHSILAKYDYLRRKYRSFIIRHHLNINSPIIWSFLTGLCLGYLICELIHKRCSWFFRVGMKKVT